MSVQHHPWLHKQLEDWRSSGLISPQLQADLAARYPVDPDQPIDPDQQGSAPRPWGRMVFSSLGAILIGLGVILFFAYNWADMPKWLKLGLIISTLVASHGAAMVIGRRPNPPAPLVHGLHALGTMLFGAGIWLVAQVYHIDEHFPNAFFVWALGALAMAWALPSRAQGFLAIVLLFIWQSCEVFVFRAELHWAPVLVLLGLGPLAWQLRSAALLFFTLLGLQLMASMTAFRLDEHVAAILIFNVSSLYLAASACTPERLFPGAPAVLRGLGMCGHLLMLYIFGFGDVTGQLLEHAHEYTHLALIYLVAPAALAALAWTVGLLVNRRSLDPIALTHALVAIATFLLANGLMLGLFSLGEWPAIVVFNLAYVAHCALLIVTGSRALNVKRVASACVLIAILVFTRYLDLFDSLLMRSAAFLLLGAGLFVVGNLYSRHKRGAAEGTV